MFIPPFVLLLALLPLIGYLGLIGSIRLFGRTLITTGARDIFALGIAISGFFAVGPTELFFPTTAASVFGPYVWIALATFYLLCLTLVAITSRAKLVIYGRSASQMYKPLLRAAEKLDSATVGDETQLQVTLPTLGIHLRLDGQPMSDHASVVAFEANLTSAFWSQLQGLLRSQVVVQPVARNTRGLLMFASAILLAAFLIWQSIGREELVVQGFREWLWR